LPVKPGLTYRQNSAKQLSPPDADQASKGTRDAPAFCHMTRPNGVVNDIPRTMFTPTGEIFLLHPWYVNVVVNDNQKFLTWLE